MTDEQRVCLTQLEALTREPNWNFEHDEAIPASEWQSAARFLEQLGGLPRPFVSPCGDGSVHFAWRASSGLRVVVQKKGDLTICEVARLRAHCSDDEAIEFVRDLLAY